MAENETVALNATENVTENVAEVANLCPLSDYVGKDQTAVIAALESRPDFTKFANILVKNVTFPKDDTTGRMTLVLSKNIPMYLKDAATGTRDLLESANLFASSISISAVLKAKGEALLADAIIKNPKIALMIVAGSRVTAFGHQFDAGEIMQNPFSTRISDENEERNFADQDNIAYYITDIILSKDALRIKAKLEDRMLDKMLNGDIEA